MRIWEFYGLWRLRTQKLINVFLRPNGRNEKGLTWEPWNMENSFTKWISNYPSCKGSWRQRQVDVIICIRLVFLVIVMWLGLGIGTWDWETEAGQCHFVRQRVTSHHGTISCLRLPCTPLHSIIYLCSSWWQLYTWRARCHWKGKQ